jgi:hypothetical protein
VRSLCNYIDDFSTSKNAVDEFQVLPETITSSITQFQADIDLLRAAFPPEIRPSVVQKVKWVYDKRKIKNITRRLAERKTDINLALSIIGRYFIDMSKHVGGIRIDRI